MSIGKWTANPFDFRAPSSLIHKEQPSMAEAFALSVGVLAFILALPSGSEVRVKEGCCFLLSSSTSVHCETASHPCVTLIWYLYLFAILQGRVFRLSRDDDGPVLFSVPAALVMRPKYRILAPAQPRV